MFREKSEDYFAAILEDPAAPRLVAKLQTALELEQQRRQQFYAEIDDDVKAEFINGEVIIHSPVKKEHTDTTGFLYMLLNLFVRLAKLGYVGYEKVMTTLTRNDYEPDVLFFNKQKSAAFGKGMWKYPAPDFVVEVLSESTEGRDRGIKYKDYEAHGVQEYWIIDPVDETIEQFFLQDGKFKLHLKASRGLIESRVVEGFAIDIRAIFEEEANFEALRKILGA